MNEIEQAIRDLQLYVDARWGGRNDMLNLALTALSEKQERDKGCEFCSCSEYPDSTLYQKEGYIFYAGYSKQIAADDFREYETEEIKFCPICGKRLEVEP